MKNIFPIALLSAAVFLAASPLSCSKRTEPAPAAAKPEAHDDHDHGGEEEHADEVKLTAEAVKLYDIATQPAQLWNLQETVVAPARIAFNTEAMAHVGSQLRGRIAAVNVRVGDAVKAGQDLLTVESPELGEAQADLMQKRTAAESAVPAVELAKIAWERGKGLYERSQGVSLTEVQKREAEYKAAQATQKAADASVLAAESRLQLLGMKKAQIETLLGSGEINPRLTIKAPIDGVIVQREATLGELVGPDRESLLIIADVSTLWVLAEVPEAKLSGLAVGNKAWVTIGSRSLPTEDGKAPAFEGQVSFVAPLIDPTTRTAQVRIDVPTDASKLAVMKPGMFAQAEIALQSATERPAQIAVPGDVIQMVEGGPALFVPVKGEPNTFAKRAVTVGAPIGGLVPILSGLIEGEQFVVRGTFILKAELGKSSAAHEH
ncbi:MAG: efflux RND transporter periplasmic adaptor subunit [Planctomycetes bacterium]|nr:efflux RND transporter periplasmic adaptor subunit [Planctomycetota bacterium]